MKFNPGHSKKVVNGRVYIKDTHQPQPIPNIPQTLKEEPKVEEEPQIEIKMSGETLRICAFRGSPMFFEKKFNNFIMA